MILHLHKYRLHMPTIKRILAREADSKDLRVQISTISVALNIPALAIAIFVQEIVGDREEVVSNIESLKAFYRYEDVRE